MNETREQLHRARLELESRRHELDETLTALEERVHRGTRLAREWAEMASAPFDYARRNPIPAAVAMGLLGFAIGRFIGSRRSSAGPETNESGSPALDRMGGEIGIA
jgi:hypothetical protein